MKPIQHYVSAIEATQKQILIAHIDLCSWHNTAYQATNKSIDKLPACLGSTALFRSGFFHRALTWKEADAEMARWYIYVSTQWTMWGSFGSQKQHRYPETIAFSPSPLLEHINFGRSIGEFAVGRWVGGT